MKGPNENRSSLGARSRSVVPEALTPLPPVKRLFATGDRANVRLHHPAIWPPSLDTIYGDER